MKHLGAILLGLAALAAVFGGMAPGPSTGPAPAPTGAPSPAAAQAPRALAAGYAGDAIRIARDASGQFHLDLPVNGSTTSFLVDTGADVVALTEGDAARAGIPVNPGDYKPILQTAGGQGWGMPVRVDRLEIGRNELRDVDAVVVRDLQVSLLGQSVLRRVGRVELQGDQLLLEPGG